MNTNIRYAIITLAAPLLALFMVTSSGAQVYQYKDKDGSISFSDDPYVQQKTPAAKKLNIQTRQTDILWWGENEEQEQAAVPPKEESAEPTTPEGKKQNDITKEGVVLMGPFQIVPSMAGKAMIRATVKNNMPYPAAGLRIDVILFTQDRQRMPDILVKYTDGKVKPDWLGPGEVAELEYESPYPRDTVVGWRYQVVWASVTMAKPEEAGPGIRKVEVKPEPGTSKDKPKAPPSNTM